MLQGSYRHHKSDENAHTAEEKAIKHKGSSPEYSDNAHLPEPCSSGVPWATNYHGVPRLKSDNDLGRSFAAGMQRPLRAIIGFSSTPPKPQTLNPENLNTLNHRQTRSSHPIQGGVTGFCAESRDRSFDKL